MSSVSSHWRAAPTCISPRTVAASPGSPRAPSSAPDRLRAAAGHAGIAVASPPRRPCSHTCTSRAPSTQRTRRPSACNGLPRHRPEAPVRHLPPILHSRLLLCTPPERAALRYAALSSPAGLVPVPGFTFPCAAVYALCLTASYLVLPPPRRPLCTTTTAAIRAAPSLPRLDPPLPDNAFSTPPRTSCASPSSPELPLRWLVKRTRNSSARGAMSTTCAHGRPTVPC